MHNRYRYRRNRLWTNTSPAYPDAGSERAAAAGGQDRKRISLPKRRPRRRQAPISALSAQEQQAVLAFSKQIDLENAQQILEYGASAQKNIADFSDTALAKVKTGDLGEIGTMLSGLLVELKTMDEPEKKGIAGLFRKAKINAEEMKSRFATAEVNVDRISGELEKHKITLLKDVAVMDQMYERNLQYFKELTMYILAGKQKLAEARSTTLQQLREKAEASNLPEDAQAANDFENKCVRFEKKLHDLELTRMISLQTRRRSA